MSFTEGNGESPKETVMASILKGAEIVTAENNHGSPSEVLSSIVIDLVEGKEGARDSAISLFRTGSEYLAEIGEDNKTALSMSSWLNMALRTTNMLHKARKIFILWPNLKSVTERYCHYVTPMLGGVGSNTMLEVSIVSAIEAYHNEQDESLKVQAYLLGLAKHAHILTCVSIKGRYRRRYVTWIPFSKPITEWMTEFRLKSIKTSSKHLRLCTDETSSALLLSRILSVEDIEIVGLKLVAGDIND